MGHGTKSQLGNNPNLQEEGLGDLKLLAEFCPPDGARGPLAPTGLLATVVKRYTVVVSE